MKNVLNKQFIDILNAREERTALKLKNVNENLHSLTLTLNIPGIPKTNSLIHRFFIESIEELKVFLKSYLIDLPYDKSLIRKDAAGDFFLLSFTEEQANPENLKILTEKFEETHSCGRMIDVDIFSATGKHISSGKNKACLVCNQYPAVDCMRNKRHSYLEIRRKIHEEISSYLNQKQKENFRNKMVSLATKAILFEVSISPKPGLVHYYDAGIHKDMHYYTFLSSSAVLSSYFKNFVNAGYHFTDKWEQVLPIIRRIGLKAEQEMFTATNGVNTQKGLIFIFGITLFTYGYLFANKIPLSEENFKKVVKRIGHNLVLNELKNNSNEDQTHGKIVYEQYGLGGVREEVESGFSTAFNTAIPFLDKHFNLQTNIDQSKINDILQTALLKIMAVNNDSNILYRSNLQLLEELKKMSNTAIDNKHKYIDVINFCKKHNVSPGGSADLLAFSLFIHFINQQINIKYEL